MGNLKPASVDPPKSPCQSCGACCATYRVNFYWREAEPEADPRVPIELTEDFSPVLRCMKGTNVKKGIRCIALKGKVGTEVSCSIYNNRPSPCRSFRRSYENNQFQKRCDEARAAHGLEPLKKNR